MAPYIVKRNRDGVHLVNIAKTWEKMMLAARVIAAIPNPADVLVFHHLVNKFRLFQAENTHKEQSLNLQHTLKLTTQVENGLQEPLPIKTQRSNIKNDLSFRFLEPRLVIVCDPRHDS